METLHKELPINTIESSILLLGTKTLESLLVCGGDCLALYLLYAKNAKEQSLSGLSQNVIKSTSSYCMGNLNWSRRKYYGTKRKLIENGLLINVVKKDINGHILGYYVLLLSKEVVFDIDLYNNIQKSKSAQNGHPYNSENVYTLIQKDVDLYNEVRVLKMDTLTSNFLREKEEKKEEEKEEKEKKVIQRKEKEEKEEEKKEEKENSAKNFFEKPVSLGEQTGFENFPCTGRYPNTCGKCCKCSLIPCTDLDIWKISEKTEIWIDYVKSKHDSIVGMIETGEFTKKYKNHKTLYGTLVRWLQRDIERGYVSTMDETHKIALKYEHPERKERVKKIIEMGKLKGLL